MLQACEQSAGRMGTQAGTGGRWTGTDGAIDKRQRDLWGRGLEGGKEEGIEMPMSREQGMKEQQG